MTGSYANELWLWLYTASPLLGQIELRVSIVSARVASLKMKKACHARQGSNR